MKKLIVAKDGFNALSETDPNNLKFSSDYGTLKYFDKITYNMQIDGSTGDFAGRYIYNHNLGYYPYCEVIVRVYIGSPGNYEYCPLYGSGASVTWNANFSISTTTLTLYGEFNGLSTSLWNFDFIIFLFKNDLKL